MSENRLMSRIFGPKREEVAGCGERLHNEELHYLCASPNVIRVIKSRRMRWVGHVLHMGEMRNAFKMFVRKTEGKRSCGRPRRRWKLILE